MITFSDGGVKKGVSNTAPPLMSLWSTVMRSDASTRNKCGAFKYSDISCVSHVSDSNIVRISVQYNRDQTLNPLAQRHLNS